MKLIEKRCAKMAQEHYDYRAKLFDMHDFDRETIAVESFKLGAKAAVKELEPVLKELVNNYESLLFALQYNIIMFNGDVPGMTREQVFDQSNDIRDRARDALQKYKQLTGVK